MKPTAYQRQLPLADLQLIAMCELQTNQTISSYDFIDGVEVRTCSNPWKRLQDSMDSVLEALCQIMGLDWDSITRCVDAIGDALGEACA